MIYLPVRENEPIEQGDIFRNIPQVEISAEEMLVVRDDSIVERSWLDVIGGNERECSAVVGIEAVTAIVISQNCDNSRRNYISLCQVTDFLETLNQTKSPPKNDNAWQSLITKSMRTNPRLFFLPRDFGFGIEDPMAADLSTVIRLRRVDLEKIRNQRIAKLKEVAVDHFRESIANYFRRYAFNEWYPLSQSQFEEYEKANEGAEPYPWQERQLEKPGH